MSDEVLELLRKNLIDVALDNHDWERLKLLTSQDSLKHVISPFYSSPFDFLCYDDHFFERRLLGNERAACLNYRYQDVVMNHMYIGEIHIPLNACVVFRYQYSPKGKRRTEPSVAAPQWFSSLVGRAQTLLAYE
jgi:hypothetical protein